MGYIYQIVDTKTHQYYLGKCQNTNPETDNYWGSGHNRLCRAAKKYKGTNPRYQKIVLINGISCNEKLAQLEELIIGDLYQTDEYCLNLKAGGWGGNISEESKAKIGAALKGRTHSAESKAKMSAAQKNRSAESKAKIGAALKGRTHSAESKANMSAAQKGRTHSAESKAKMSAAKKGKTHSAESKAKIGAASKGNQHSRGRTHSAESKARMSAAAKGNQNRLGKTKARINATKIENNRKQTTQDTQ
jgi:hypothetical protein